MTPYKLAENVVIDLDHFVDAVWQFDDLVKEMEKKGSSRRRLYVRFAAQNHQHLGPISHVLDGENADRFWQFLLDRTPEAVEASALGRLVDAYVTLVGGMGPAVDDPDRFTVRIVDIGHVRDMMEAAKADLEQRST